MTLNDKKDDIYEQFVCDYINQQENTVAYLWKNVPDKILFECNLIDRHDDFIKNRSYEINIIYTVGIDIIVHNQLTNVYSFVKCKNCQNVICIGDLGEYFCIMAQRKHANKNGFIYISNNLISKNLLKTCEERITFVHLPILS